MPSIPNLLIFAIATGIIIIGALFVVLNKKPINSALGLLGTFLGITVFYMQLEAHFLAAVQVIVYASAVVILFLFVIMLVGDTEEDKPRFEFVLPVFFIAVLLVIMAQKYNLIEGKPTQISKNSSSINDLAYSLFTTYAWPFVMLVGLLVASVVGAVALVNKTEENVERAAKKKKKSLLKTKLLNKKVLRGKSKPKTEGGI
jgi:NADH-quinone oxidoreductase subunit J